MYNFVGDKMTDKRKIGRIMPRKRPFLGGAGLIQCPKCGVQLRFRFEILNVNVKMQLALPDHAVTVGKVDKKFIPRTVV